MNYEEIHAAATELCAISARDPEAIDLVAVAQQFRRMETAGLPIVRNPILHAMRERAYERLERLRNWPLSDSPEERAKYRRDSIPFFMAIAVEAGRLQDEGA